MKKSRFRLWCSEKWFEHLDELSMYNTKDELKSSDEYFKKYKFWLKREYKHQEGQSK